MTFLAFVLVFKILGSLPLIAGPLLLASPERLGGGVALPPPMVTTFRLYGVSILAVLVGYAYGLWLIGQGQYPWGVVAMGLVSNFGGAALMWRSGGWRRSRATFAFILTVGTLLVASAVLQALGVG